MAGWPPANVKFVSGEDNTISYTHPKQVGNTNPNPAETGRKTCKTCGSKVCNQFGGLNGFPIQNFVTDSEALGGSGAGTIPEGLEAQVHFNYGSAVVESHDKLPKYVDFPAPLGSGKLAEEGKDKKEKKDKDEKKDKKEDKGEKKDKDEKKDEKKDKKEDKKEKK